MTRVRRGSERSTRNPDRIQFARDQRAMANEFSSIVWQMVRGRRIEGMKFRREVPEPPYTLDFVCIELKLVIEVDGKHHFSHNGLQHDQDRDAFLRRKGYDVLRIPGYDVLREPSTVRERIVDSVRARIRELSARH